MTDTPTAPDPMLTRLHERRAALQAELAHSQLEFAKLMARMEEVKDAISWLEGSGRKVRKSRATTMVAPVGEREPVGGDLLKEAAE